MTGTGILAAVRSNAIAAGVAIVSAAVLFLSVKVGMGARTRVAETERRIQSVQQDSARAAQLRQTFVPADSAEEALWASIDRQTTALGIEPRERIGLAASIYSLADSLGLRDVRVSFPGLDSSATIEERPSFSTVAFRMATYAVAVSAEGPFADVVRLVAALPPSVTPYRFSADRGAPRGRYRLLLAVFEREGGNGSQ
jgi:hypothetical protein